MSSDFLTQDEVDALLRGVCDDPLPEPNFYVNKIWKINSKTYYDLDIRNTDLYIWLQSTLTTRDYGTQQGVKNKLYPNVLVSEQIYALLLLKWK
jgi:hypothetical protein